MLPSPGMLPSRNDAWPTDEDLRAAYDRFAAQIPGYVQPTAYTLARRGPDGLTVGHLNEPGGEHKLPAAVLALVCGYVNRRRPPAMRLATAFTELAQAI